MVDYLGMQQSALKSEEDPERRKIESTMAKEGKLLAKEVKQITELAQQFSDKHGSISTEATLSLSPNLVMIVMK